MQLLYVYHWAIATLLHLIRPLNPSESQSINVIVLNVVLRYMSVLNTIWPHRERAECEYSSDKGRTADQYLPIYVVYVGEEREREKERKKFQTMATFLGGVKRQV